MGVLTVTLIGTLGSWGSAYSRHRKTAVVGDGLDNEEQVPLGHVDGDVAA